MLKIIYNDDFAIQAGDRGRSDPGDENPRVVKPSIPSF